MNKIVFGILAVLILAGCKKEKKEIDRYEGEFYIQFLLNNETLSVNKTASQLSFAASPQKWKTEKLDSNKYVISPISDPNFILANNGALSPVFVTRPISIISPEVFSFETSSNGLVNIKSAGDNRYLVFQYGLNTSGNIVSWNFGFDRKTPCSSNFAGATSDGCQYDFNLVRSN